MPISNPTKAAGEPTWEIAQLYPNHGFWSEAEYLALASNHLIEYSHGYLEFLPFPTQSHQLIVAFVHRLLLAYIEEFNLGIILFAPLRIKLWEGKFREPDIVFMKEENTRRLGEKYWEGADLVIEVVSGSTDDRERDLETKRREYSKAGIPEYWIVDPKVQVIQVLHLSNSDYEIHGRFSPGQNVTSVLFSNFSAEVEAIFASANA